MKPLKSGPGYLILAISLVLSFPAGAQENADDAAIDADAEQAVSDTAADACFSLRQSHSMSALDDRSIYVETSGNRNFLLTAATTCPGLKGAMGIAIRSREGDRVCGGGLASVTYQRFGAGPPVSCSVNKIVSVQDKAEAESISEAQAE